MATHCLSSRELWRCGLLEGFEQAGKGLAVGKGESTGVFVSRVYDSGGEGTQWDRVCLDIAETAAIEAYVWLFDSKREAEEEIREPRRWFEEHKGSAQYCSNYRNMLLYGNGGGRYARLAVEIQPGSGEETLFDGYDLSFPKESFTRYLPPIFQGCLPLERFLAIQEDTYLRLEADVDMLPEKLDYELCGSWQAARLARWMGWGELAAKKAPLEADILRRLLGTGTALSSRKGTCGYYVRLTELLTGRRAVMVEEPEKRRVVVLVLGQPRGDWNRCRGWLMKNAVIGIDMDFIVLRRTDRLDGQCFLDKTAALSKYEAALLAGGCLLEGMRLL